MVWGIYRGIFLVWFLSVVLILVKMILEIIICEMYVCMMVVEDVWFVLLVWSMFSLFGILIGVIYKISFFYFVFIFLNEIVYFIVICLFYCILFLVC